LGDFEAFQTTWGPQDTVHFKTSYRTYADSKAIVFKQTFNNEHEDMTGLSQRSLSIVGGLNFDRGINEISSSYPSLVPNLNEGPKGFWSFGGRMSGTPCISIGR